MSLFSLVLVNLGRNKRRTILTMLSVVVALFLFCALRGVLDTLHASIQVSSEARLVTRNAISLIFPLPLSYRERLTAIPSVQSVSYANWFGGRDPVDPGNFYAQFAVDAPTYLPMYTSDIEIVAADPPQAEIAVPSGLDPKLAAFLGERDACVVGERLFKRMKWKLGQKVRSPARSSPAPGPSPSARSITRRTPRSARSPCSSTGST